MSSVEKDGIPFLFQIFGNRQAYPAHSAYTGGMAISGLTDVMADRKVLTFHAGTKRQGTEIVTSGGRVLGITSVASHLSAARDQAYEAVRRVSFQGCHFRSDIASRALPPSG